jgi:hypothetical protein
MVPGAGPLGCVAVGSAVVVIAVAPGSAGGGEARFAANRAARIGQSPMLGSSTDSDIEPAGEVPTQSVAAAA